MGSLRHETVRPELGFKSFGTASRKTLKYRRLFKSRIKPRPRIRRVVVSPMLRALSR